jgi:hypothetical protein
VILFAVGVGVLAAIVAVVGWRPVAEQLAAVGWWFPVLVLLYAFVELAFAYGWKVIIGRRRDGPVRFPDTFAAYLASLSNQLPRRWAEADPGEAARRQDQHPRALATVTVHRHAEMTSSSSICFWRRLDRAFPLPRSCAGRRSEAWCSSAMILWMTFAPPRRPRAF